MGRGQGPTPDELKFIYELFSEGYSDADIVAKYDELEKHGKLGILHSRSDIRFFRQRRKEFEAAKEVLKGKQQTLPDYVIRHWEDLSNVAKQIEGMWRRDFDRGLMVPSRYIIDDPEFYSFKLENGYMARQLLQHLKAEYPQGFDKISGWEKLLWTPLPDGCIEKILQVASRRTFEGTCDICQGWSLK